MQNRNEKVVNVSNHYEPGNLVASNKAELDAALEDGWQFKSIAPIVTINNPYLISPNLLNISYVLEKTQNTNEQKQP